MVVLAVVTAFVLSRSGEEQRPLTFVDVAAQVGIETTHSAFRWEMSMDPVAMMGGGLCWIDVDNDGWLDLFVTDTWSNGEWGKWSETGGLPTTKLFQNLEGTFSDVTESWGAGFEVRANGCAAADLDGDGFTDLYVTTERENLLLWNEGGDRFRDGALEAGVQAYGWSTGVAAGDIDGDGLTDLVVAGYADLNRPVADAQTGFPNTFEPIADSVFLNMGGAKRSTFASIDAGMEEAGFEYGLGTLLTDFDADGDLDLYVANDTQPNRLYENESMPGVVRLVDVSAASGTDDPNSGMGIAIADADGDLLSDLVVTNLAGQGHMAVERTSGLNFASAFSAVRELGTTATGWGTSFGDFDNDGDNDLLVASGAIPIVTIGESSEALTFLRNENGDFVDDSAAVALDLLSDRNGRAVAIADYDNDGDLDVAISAIGESLVLLENQSVGGDWLLVETSTPTPGLRVRVHCESGLTMESTSSVGSSWLSSEDPRVHIGLPPGDPIRRVEVFAADGSLLFGGTPERNQILSIED